MDSNKTSAESVLATLRLELLCPLCGELFTDPVAGRCGHTFCRACAGKLLQDASQFPCPQCQGPCSSTELAPNHIVASVLKHIRLVGHPSASPATVTVQESGSTPDRHSQPIQPNGDITTSMAAGTNGALKAMGGTSQANLGFSTPTGRLCMPETVPESPEGLFSLMQELAAVGESPMPCASCGGTSVAADGAAPPVFNRAWVEHFLVQQSLPTPEQCTEMEKELVKLSKVIADAKELLGCRHIETAAENGTGAAGEGHVREEDGEMQVEPMLVAAMAPKEEVEMLGGAAAAETQKSGGLSRFDSQTIRRNADIDAALKARGFELGESADPLEEEEEKAGTSLPAVHETNEKLDCMSGGGAKSRDSPENMAEMERGAAAVLSGRFSKARAAPLELDVSNAGLTLAGGRDMAGKEGGAISDMEMIGIEGLSNLQNFRFGEVEAVDMQGGRRVRRNPNGRRGQWRKGCEAGMDVVMDDAAVGDRAATIAQTERKSRKPQRRRRKVVPGRVKPRGGGGKKKPGRGEASDVTGDTNLPHNKRGKGQGTRKRPADGAPRNDTARSNGGRVDVDPSLSKRARRHRVLHRSVKKEEHSAEEHGIALAEVQDGERGAADGQDGKCQPGGEVIERVSARDDRIVTESEGGSGLTTVKSRIGKRRSSNVESSSGSKRHRPLDMVGKVVEIYWDGMQCWYKGSVGEFCSKDKKYLVAYEDGETHWESLPSSQKGERWRLCQEDGGVHSVEIEQQAAVHVAAPKQIAASDLEEEKRALVRSFCDVHGAALVDEVTSETTHLVVVPVEGNRARKRTEKLMRAVLHGCAIVSWGWMEASIKSGAWQPETEFLLQGDVKSKVDWRGVRMEHPMFTELQFAVEPARGKLQTLVEELILIGGGCVLRTPAPLGGDDAKFSVISVGHRTRRELKAIQVKWGKPAIRHEWIFDSVSAKTLLPQDGYQS